MPIRPFPFCSDVHALVPEILADWQHQEAGQPWFAQPAEHGFDLLPDLIGQLLTTACCAPDDGAKYRAMLAAASDHGAQRRAQGFGQELLPTEYHLLREAVWRVLRRHAPDHALRAVFHVDRAITVATRASFVGYHREALAAAGRWPAALEQVADEPLFGHDGTRRLV